MSEENKMTVSGLNSVLTQFLDEIDKLADSDQYLDEAPCSEWIVHVDPTTSQSFYRHIQSGETKWDMPKEYEVYLKQFDAYLQLHSQDNDAKSAATSQNTKKRKRHMLTKKRKCPKQACDPVDDSNGQSNQILTAYSDSSGLESDHDCDTQAEDHSKYRSDDQKKEALESDNSNSVIVPLVSYGPLDDISILEPRDFAKTYLSSLVREKAAKSTRNSTVSNGLSTQTEPCNQSNKQMRQIKSAMKKLLKKFSSLNERFSDISSPRLLYIQLLTRFDDWQAGQLSTDYFFQKLFETERSISELQDDDSPLTSRKR